MLFPVREKVSLESGALDHSATLTFGAQGRDSAAQIKAGSR